MRTRKAKDRSRLIQAAMGQIPCDLTIGNVQFFNVITGEIYPASVDILDGFVVLVREEGQEAVLPSKSYYDGQGRYLIPGYIDTHMHDDDPRKSRPRHSAVGHDDHLHRPARDRQRHGPRRRALHA